jgi:hypothetical protein
VSQSITRARALGSVNAKGDAHLWFHVPFNSSKLGETVQ